jgi:hypothetical protein
VRIWTGLIWLRTETSENGEEEEIFLTSWETMKKDSAASSWLYFHLQKSNGLFEKQSALFYAAI